MPPSSNAFLASLSADDFAALKPHLRQISLPPKAVLFRAGDTISTITMPHEGIVSLLVDVSHGDSVECATIGRDGIVGASSIADGGTSFCTAVVQAPLTGSVVDASRLHELADMSTSLRAIVHRFDLLVQIQAQQSTACNVMHHVEARLARWLLRCRYLIQSDDLNLTQEYIAQMLGVKRTTVSITASTLQKAGLIRYRRGHIQIIDIERLHESACECYDVVTGYTEKLIGRTVDSRAL